MLTIHKHLHENCTSTKIISKTVHQIRLNKEKNNKELIFVIAHGNVQCQRFFSKNKINVNETHNNNSKESLNEIKTNKRSMFSLFG